MKKKYISFIIVALLMLTLIPIQAFASKSTQVHIRNVSSSAVEVYVNFSDGSSISCEKTGSMWRIPDSGEYVSDDILSITIWYSDQSITLPRAVLDFGVEAGGTVNISIGDYPDLPELPE
ncbi:MAG: hypothetical protein R2876_05890 [Eubacteriales bacterium]